MLENPIMIGGAPFEMPDSRGKVALSEWLRKAFASDPHDTACRRAKIFPFSAPHWIKIDLAQEGFGQSREISQCLGIDFSRHHTACLARRRIQCKRILNLDPFGQKICLTLPLHDGFPLFRGSGRGYPDEDDRKHEHEVGDPSLIDDTLAADGGHRMLGDCIKTIVARSNFVGPHVWYKPGLSGPSG